MFEFDKDAEGGEPEVGNTEVLAAQAVSYMESGEPAVDEYENLYSAEPEDEPTNTQPEDLVADSINEYGA